MAARKEIVSKTVSQGMPVSKALAIAEIPRSSYYYKSNGKRKGKTPSTHTQWNNLLVDNERVIDEINSILGKEFIDYGYERTASELKKRGFYINKKKVYRLMKENQLLFPKIKINTGQRQYVDYTIPLPTRPLEVIELDIKYIYIHGLKRHEYLITMMYVCTRNALKKDNKLLCPKIKINTGQRQFVDYTIPLPPRPLEVIELDIKYIYIHGLKRHAYLITMLDVFSRTALVWELNRTMKAKDAVRLVGKLINEWLFPMHLDPHKLSVKIRTDNGSQFIAKTFKDSLQEARISNEYIRPATPQQNAHIESFHNTLSRLVCG